MTTKAKKRTTPAAKPVSQLKVLPKGGRNGKKDVLEQMAPEPVPSGEQHLRVAEHLIDFSPLNYRRYFDPGELEALAVSIVNNGQIEEVTVRVVVEGRYELVVGERRVRACRLGNVAEVRVVVRTMTDEQVVQAQIAENIDRADPHIMEEAQGIGKLLKVKKSVNEIAAWLGRPVKFVYDRSKLLKLIDDLQEMFMANRFTLLEALEIAGLDKASQESFFATHCQKWKESERRPFSDLRYILSTYQRQLKDATFDIRDESLIPSVGSCMTCSFNTACITSLFPVESTKAVCTHKSCFEDKSKLAFRKRFADAVTANQVTALIYFGEISSHLQDALDNLPADIQLVTHDANTIREVAMPDKPTREQFLETGHMLEDEDEDEDYFIEDEEEDEDPGFYPDDDDYDDEEELYEEDEDDEELAEQEPAPLAEGAPVMAAAAQDANGDAEIPAAAMSAPEPVFDEEAYQEALEEYEERLADYKALVGDGPIGVGIKVGYGRKVFIVHFVLRQEGDPHAAQGTAPAFTAKEVELHLKAGTATPDMLEGEIQRVKTWHARKDFLGKTLVQGNIHKEFDSFVSSSEAITTRSDADQAGLLWFGYMGLSYSDKHEVEKVLFPDIDLEEDGELTVDHFINMPEAKQAYLSRKVLLGRDASKNPGSLAGQLLYKMAAPWIDILSIEETQNTINSTRHANAQKKIDGLNKQIHRLDPTRPKAIPDWAQALAVQDCDTLDQFLDKYQFGEKTPGSSEDAKERALYAGRLQVKSQGYASIDSQHSLTGKMVVFIPQE